MARQDQTQSKIGEYRNDCYSDVRRHHSYYERRERYDQNYVRNYKNNDLHDYHRYPARGRYNNRYYNQRGGNYLGKRHYNYDDPCHNPSKKRRFNHYQADMRQLSPTIPPQDLKEVNDSEASIISKIAHSPEVTAAIFKDITEFRGGMEDYVKYTEQRRQKMRNNGLRRSSRLPHPSNDKHDPNFQPQPHTTEVLRNNSTSHHVQGDPSHVYSKNTYDSSQRPPSNVTEREYRPFRDISTLKCFRCNQLGHFGKHCKLVPCRLCFKTGHSEVKCPMNSDTINNGGFY